MKKLFMLSLLQITFLLSGCGHTSDTKPINIEQFKCQESIETVFNVLGETDMETNTFIGECYRYENLNLFGYNGYALFRVRDNKDTIQSFECYFELNKKEFEDVLSQLKDKYGEYKKSVYSNQIAYVWEIPEDKAEQLGYNRISFSDCGDKKAVIDFSDEWSIYKDEAYYEYLEEKENKKNELEILADKTYSIGEDTFYFSFGKRENGEYSFMLLCKISNKSDAFCTHIFLNSIMNSDDESIKPIRDIFAYSIFVGDGTVLTRTNSAMLLMSADGEMLSTDDYFSAEWFRDESADSDYGAQIIDFLIDFIQ